MKDDWTEQDFAEMRTDWKNRSTCYLANHEVWYTIYFKDENGEYINPREDEIDYAPAHNDPLHAMSAFYDGAAKYAIGILNGTYCETDSVVIRVQSRVDSYFGREEREDEEVVFCKFTGDGYEIMSERKAYSELMKTVEKIRERLLNNEEYWREEE